MNYIIINDSNRKIDTKLTNITTLLTILFTSLTDEEDTDTYYWNVSLYFGDQLLFLVLVLNLRFLSARCGPTALTSTNGRNMALVCQMRLFTPTTEIRRGNNNLIHYDMDTGTRKESPLILPRKIVYSKLSFYFWTCIYLVHTDKRLNVENVTLN